MWSVFSSPLPIINRPLLNKENPACEVFPFSRKAAKPVIDLLLSNSMFKFTFHVVFLDCVFLVPVKKAQS